MKNTRKIFLALTLIVLLLGVSSVVATEDDTTSIDDVVSDTTTVSTDNAVITEQIQTSSSTDNSMKTKIKKEDKTLKTSTRTMEINDFESLMTATYDQLDDTEHDTYIMNINENITTTTEENNRMLSLTSTNTVKTVIFNGNNKTLNTMYNIQCNANHELEINNMTVYLRNTLYNRGGTLIIKNSNIIINSSNNAIATTSGTMIIDDNTQINIINGKVLYKGGTIYTNNTLLIEKLKEAGCPDENINPAGEENKNKIIENENILNVYTIYPTYNYTFINCNISSSIVTYNNSNVTFRNCSFSNNEMGATSVTQFGNLGFLLLNNGTASLIGCVMENNTFNISYGSSILNGAIYNNGSMNIVNCSFHNNSIGYSIVDSTAGAMQGFHFGRGCAIVNNATLTVDNSNFTSNYAGESGGAIYDNGVLNVNNSYFADNVVGLQGGAISLFGTGCIENSVFVNNTESLNHNVIGNTGGGAIYSAGYNQIINNCTFRDNKAICEITGLMFVGSTGGAIRSTTNNLTVNECEFINNYATTNGNAIEIRSDSTGTVMNSYFENNETDAASEVIEVIAGHGNIVNNTFTNINNTDYVINIASGQTGISAYISENRFINNKVNIDTVNIGQDFLTTNMGQDILTTENNIYQNTTINDNIILNIPDYTYSGEAITITGTYYILNSTFFNPETGTYESLNTTSYDKDILEQNHFQVYIDGELVDTIDILEFTITPTSENMLITVQPTISQTRKTAIITPTTINFNLDDITATIGETAELTAHITATTDGEDMEVDTERVYFKVNGKILRDTTTGRIIYADVTDNTATADYLVPKTWNEETEITAVYTGNDDLPQKTSNTVNPTITTPETSQVEFTVADATATQGEEITITVTTKNLDNGKVVLKVNGKTVKASDGKLYAKVTADTTTFTYTVPKTYKAGYYDIKAVYTSGATKLEAENKLSVE